MNRKPDLLVKRSTIRKRAKRMPDATVKTALNKDKFFLCLGHENDFKYRTNNVSHSEVSIIQRSAFRIL